MAIIIRSNRIRKFQAGRSAFLAGALLLSSCGGGAPIDWSKIPQPDPGYVIEDAYIPYVEEVVFPEPIYAGEEFYVGLVDCNIETGSILMSYAGHYETECKRAA
jgi:hypothetical protein